MLLVFWHGRDGDPEKSATEKAGVIKFLRILVHNHEHMGQAVAYARMNGIVPPWSGAGG